MEQKMSIKDCKLFIYDKYKTPKIFKKFCLDFNLNYNEIRAICIKLSNNSNKEFFFTKNKFSKSERIWEKINSYQKDK
ncbi:hypothetical protein AJY73_10530 [Campylobacter jejuni]|nr:hypothetical protein AJY73_10530 [Campylobacter jejuni]OEZ15062.1 hypothetical protein A0L49_08780 [Campylobacter jejuni]